MDCRSRAGFVTTVRYGHTSDPTVEKWSFPLSSGDALLGHLPLYAAVYPTPRRVGRPVESLPATLLPTIIDCYHTMAR